MRAGARELGRAVSRAYLSKAGGVGVRSWGRIGRQGIKRQSGGGLTGTSELCKFDREEKAVAVVFEFATRAKLQSQSEKASGGRAAAVAAAAAVVVLVVSRDRRRICLLIVYTKCFISSTTLPPSITLPTSQRTVCNRITRLPLFHRNRFQKAGQPGGGGSNSNSGGGGGASGLIANLTAEQRSIVLADVKAGGVLTVLAFAGTGKTTCLRAYAQARPHLKILYLTVSFIFGGKGQMGVRRFADEEGAQMVDYSFFFLGCGVRVVSCWDAFILC